LYIVLSNEHKPKFEKAVRNYDLLSVKHQRCLLVQKTLFRALLCRQSAWCLFHDVMLKHNTLHYCKAVKRSPTEKAEMIFKKLHWQHFSVINLAFVL